ncbi:MAG: 6-carboxytetrahydropterin synthase QueD [Nitrospinae bacterium]|nr:6-carboxytetrahydropterin synthase QueD [Nitrospinota bacterium]
MGMYEVAVKSSFSAAHQLIGHEGACADLHGHNWTVEAMFAAPQLDEIQMVVDFYHVKKAMETLIGKLDHKILNEVPPFDEANPTAEKLAEYFYTELKKSLPVPPSLVKVFETDHTWASYRE